MVQPLALPTFVTGAKDDLATVDVYKVNTDQVVTNVKTLTDEANPDRVKALKGMFSGVQEASSVLKGISGSQTLSKASLMDRVLSLSPSANNAFRSLTGGLQEKILGNLGKTSLSAESVRGVGNMVSSVRASDLSSAQSLGGFVGRYTGIDPKNILNFKDQRFTANLMSVVIRESMNLGVHGLTKDLLTAVNDRTTINFMAEHVSQDIARRGSYADLYHMADHSSPNQIVGHNPDIIHVFASSYSPRTPSNNTDYETNYQGIMQAFRRVDPTWDIRVRNTTDGPEQCVDLTQLLGGSVIFNETLKLHGQLSANPTEKAYMAASVFKPTSVKEELNHQFNEVVLHFDQQNQKTEDPRVLM